MLHDTKTVNGSNFDQETTEKMAPPFVAQLDCRNRGLKRREAGVGKERMSSGDLGRGSRREREQMWRGSKMGEGARWEREQGGNEQGERVSKEGE